MTRNRHRTMSGIEYMIVDKNETHLIKIEPAIEQLVELNI